MLARRKAKQEGDTNDQVYRYQVREAEKSPTVVMYNVKQKMLLDKQISFLEKSKKMVVDRISVNQKVMFSTFNRRLNSAKINQARLSGDVKKQREVRVQASKQSRFGLSAEEEDILRKIWKSGSQRPADLELSVMSLDKSSASNSSMVYKSKEIRSSTLEKPEDSNKITQRKRMKPTSAVTPRTEARMSATRLRSKSAVSRIVPTNHGNEHSSISSSAMEQVQCHNPAFQERQARIRSPDLLPCLHVQLDSDSDDIDGDCQSKALPVAKMNAQNLDMPPSHGFMNNCGDRREPRYGMQRSKSFAGKRAHRHTTLLDLHKQKLGKSDVMSRMHTLLDSMHPYTSDKDRIDRDHYSHAVDELAREGWGARQHSANPGFHQHDTKQATQVSNLTVKAIPGDRLFKTRQKVHFA